MSMRSRSVTKLRWIVALCVIALVAVWGLYAVSRNVFVVLHSGGYVVRISHGYIYVDTYTTTDENFPPASWPMQGIVYADWLDAYGQLPEAEQFQIAVGPGSSHGQIFRAFSLFPMTLWLSAGIIALTVWRAWLHWRRVRAARHLLCERCGYSLAGLTGPTCPECGASGALKT
ncbi:MAG TPA: hypothetical protein VK157_06140 [Phycisphaerales bacterium]|nr:hypothetical protein [Phycisphaerales bacterium]